MGLALQRLGDDWQQVHGHPLPLAETFVDPARFAGTRYRAAGWRELGMTRGFAENPTRYRHHGQPKIVFVKPLRPLARQWLANLVPDPAWRCPMTTLTLTIPHIETLRQHLATLPDFRKPIGLRHNLRSVLLIAIWRHSRRFPQPPGSSANGLSGHHKLFGDSSAAAATRPAIPLRPRASPPFAGFCKRSMCRQWTR
ncbi:MAG: DUF4338 domain-containing protein [Magnetococcales bacterium]|nr:DUF4338 domain-containing protein [Magnetococcales bacterium]